MSHFYQPDDDTWEGRFMAYITEAEKQIDELRAALDQERADNERLRACMDELRQGALHMPMTLDRIDVIECLRAHGMCETDGNPTALLSGRWEGGNDG